MQTQEPRTSDIFTASDHITTLVIAYRKWYEAGRGPDSREDYLEYSKARKAVLNLIVKGLRAQ